MDLQRVRAQVVSPVLARHSTLNSLSFQLLGILLLMQLTQERASLKSPASTAFRYFSKLEWQFSASSSSFLISWLWSCSRAILRVEMASVKRRIWWQARAFLRRDLVKLGLRLLQASQSEMHCRYQLRLQKEVALLEKKLWSLGLSLMASVQHLTASSNLLALKALLPSFFQSSADFQMSICLECLIRNQSTTFKHSPRLENTLFLIRTSSATHSPSNCSPASPGTFWLCKYGILRKRYFAQFRSARQLCYLVCIQQEKIMTKQFLTINKQFLQQNSYQQLYQNSLSLNKKYNDLCDLLKKAFKSLSENDLEVPTPRVNIGFVEGKKQFKFVKELKKFIRCFTDVSKEMSQYQISCFQSLKEGNVPELDVAFQILQKVRQNKELYESIESKKTILIESYAEVKRKYQKFQKHIINPNFYYQPELVRRKEEELKEEMNKSWKLMSDILAKREEVHQKIQFFQPYLSTYRKKLVKNKYSVLKKLVFLIKNTKNATIQIFDALRGCAIENKQHYIGVIADKEDNVSHLSDYLKRKMIESSSHIEHSTEENKKWEKYTSQCVRQFQDTFQQIDVIFSQLASYFNHYCDTCNQQHQLFRSIAVKISEYFHEQESPYPMLKELLDLQVFFNQKFQHVVVKMQEIRNKLRFERNNCKKQADILLTMIKVNKNNYHSTMDNLNRDEELLALIEKISFQTSKKIIVSFYDQFINLENDLLNKFDSEKHRKKKVFDSMDISHTAREPQYAEKKVPLKQEYWLWKEWRAEIQINFQNYNSFFKDIDKQIEKVKTNTNCKESSEIQIYNCVLLEEKEEIKGKLQVKVNSLDFTSREVKLCLPWKQIQGIQKEDKMFKDFLVITTLKGNIKFFQLQNLQGAIQSLRESHEKGLMGNKKKIQRKPEVILSAQQIMQIDKRKQQIQQRIPSLKDYMPVVDRVFEGERIDQIYQLFYSDKPFSFYGKEEPNFFSYTGKKGGNYNWETEKYDQPGPFFYSGDKDVSFDNCPLFSSRKTSFNHPIKASGIPFMPEFSLNSDVQKLYWISNEQFLYTMESNTEGVPYSDSFVVFLAHRVQKVQEGVKIEVFLFIKWVKETIMKGTVEGNIIPEVKENKEQILAEMDKVLKLMRSLQLGEEVQIQQEEAQYKVAKKEPPNELSKLKQYNRFLIFGFIGLVVVNVLFLIIF